MTHSYMCSLQCDTAPENDLVKMVDEFLTKVPDEEGPSEFRLYLAVIKRVKQLGEEGALREYERIMKARSLESFTGSGVKSTSRQARVSGAKELTALQAKLGMMSEEKRAVYLREAVKSEDYQLAWEIQKVDIRRDNFFTCNRFFFTCE